MKKFSAAFLAVLIALICTACSTGPAAQNTSAQKKLTITYDSSLYGTAWMDSLLKSFEKAHPDILVKVTADANLTTHYPALIASGKKAPDLLFIRRTNWQEDAKAGRLATLDSLYAEKTDTGGTILQKLDGSFLPACQLNGHEYLYPWGVETGGFLYDASLFSANGWTVPETVSELETLCQRIREAGIAPFAWSAERTSDWTDILAGWWAEYEGKAGIQTFLAMQNSSVYTQQGRLQALSALEKLLPNDSYGSPLSMKESEAVSAFTSGKAAMLPAGYLSAFAQNAPSSSMDLRMMALPATDGAKDRSLSAAYLTGIAVIPAKASSPSLAKTFLAFSATDTAIASFISDTGYATPFTIDQKQYDALPHFLKTAATVWQHDTVYMTSSSEVYNTRLFDWPSQGSPVIAIFSGTRTAKQIFDADAQMAQVEWYGSAT